MNNDNQSLIERKDALIEGLLKRIVMLRLGLQEMIQNPNRTDAVKEAQLWLDATGFSPSKLPTDMLMPEVIAVLTDQAFEPAPVVEKKAAAGGRGRGR